MTKTIYIFLALFILILSTSSFGQTNRIKGEGLISVKIENLPILEFYESIDSETPIKRIKVFNDTAIKSFNIENLTQIRNEWFKPLHIHLDYYIFFFQCCQIKEQWFQVIINEKTDLKYWIKESTCLKYLTWENFITEVIAVKPTNPDINPILNSPDINSDKSKMQPIDCLTPVSVIGDWLKVRIEPAICDMTHEMGKDEIFDGFIRWKSGDKLLIEYFMLL